MMGVTEGNRLTPFFVTCLIGPPHSTQKEAAHEGSDTLFRSYCVGSGRARRTGADRHGNWALYIGGSVRHLPPGIGIGTPFSLTITYDPSTYIPTTTTVNGFRPPAIRLSSRQDPTSSQPMGARSWNILSDLAFKS
jgi:hypothetical protein